MIVVNIAFARTIPHRAHGPDTSNTASTQPEPAQLDPALAVEPAGIEWLGNSNVRYLWPGSKGCSS